MFRKLSFLFMLAVMLTMVVGIGVAYANNPGTLEAKKSVSEFTVNEHSPPGQVCANIITANCVPANTPSCQMDMAIANAPNKENADQKQEVAYTNAGAQERAGPAVADQYVWTNLTNSANINSPPTVSSYEFDMANYCNSDATWANDRAGPANYSEQITADGQMNVANFQCATNIGSWNADEAKEEWVAESAIGKSAVFNVNGHLTATNQAGEAPILTQVVYAPNIGETNLADDENNTVQAYQTGTAGGIPASIANTIVNDASNQIPLNRSMAAVPGERRYPNPYA